MVQLFQSGGLLFLLMDRMSLVLQNPTILAFLKIYNSAEVKYRNWHLKEST